jgi:hypothetical protein
MLSGPSHVIVQSKIATKRTSQALWDVRRVRGGGCVELFAAESALGCKHIIMSIRMAWLDTHKVTFLVLAGHGKKTPGPHDNVPGASP